MGRLIDVIFALPPIEQRVNIENTLIKRMSSYKRACKEKNDTYIHYQIAFFSFWIFFFIGLIFLSLRYLPCLDIHPLFSRFREKEIYDIQVSYVWTCAITCAIGLFPFFLIKYFKNVDIKKEDIFWCNDYYIKSGGFTKAGLLFRSFISVVTSLFVSYAVISLPDTASSGGRISRQIAPLLIDSPLSFGGFILIVSFLLTCFYFLLIMSCVSFYKGCVSTTVQLKRPI